MIRSILVLALSFVSAMTFGQLSVSVSTDQDSINFGDVVRVTYQINAPQGAEIQSLDFSSLKTTQNLAYASYPDQLDSIMDIDIVDGGAFKIENSNLVARKTQEPFPLKGEVTLRISSVGALFLPKPIINHNSGLQVLDLETPPLLVKPVNALDNLNPDWSIIEEQVSWRDYLIYLYMVLGVLALIGVVFLLIKYLKKDKVEVSEVKEVVKLPAHEIALQSLTQLKEAELWQKGEMKAYHTELTRVMRQYIEDRYTIQALEMTSSQLKKELKTQGIPSDIIVRFDDILQIADKVKFAKGSTGPEINMKFMDEAFAIVNETKKVVKDIEAEK